MTCTPLVPESTRIGRTALVVSDLDEMIDFYRDVVGLTVQTTSATSATLGADETPLLVLDRDADAPPRHREQAGLFHNAFLVPSRAALGAALDRIHDRWTLTGASDHYVSEALYLDDPEGNGVELYYDRPRDEWERSDDGTIRIGTVPLDLADVASQSNGDARVPPGTSVGHVHLEASSLATAREFYVETLGFRVTMEMRSALFLAAGEYHHHLGINTWNGRSQPAGGRGLAWFELVVSSAEALSAVRHRLEDADVAVCDRPDGFELADPDGISIRIRVA